MYNEYFNLHSLPFENTPDPRFFYDSDQHREAMAAIEYTIRMRKGFVLITGDIGSGKTTVGRTVCSRCNERATIVQVLHGHESPMGLLQQILRAMNVRYQRDDDHGRLIERLRKTLMQMLERDRPVVLFIDEAQTLSDEALQELRLLSNLDTDTDKSIQIALVGQPELRSRIADKRFAALRQRIVLAKQLRPLSIQDTHDYIAHRLSTASNDPKHIGVTFNGAAVQEIYNHTQGVPRLINVVCDNCLLLGFVRESREITAAMVRRVVQDMVPCFDEAAEEENQLTSELRLAGNF